MPDIKDNVQRTDVSSLLRLLQGSHKLHDPVNGEEEPENAQESSDSLSNENEGGFLVTDFNLGDSPGEGEAMTRNPDDFYSDLTITVQEETDLSPSDDKMYKYVSIGTASDRRYSNNSERRPNPRLEATDGKLTSQQAYRFWEQHDAVTKREISPERDDIDEDNMEDGSHTGGLYQPFRPGLTALATEDAMRLLRLPPAAKYRDLLNLIPVGARISQGLESSRKYKNNLSSTIHAGGCDYLVVCCRSEILVYDFNPQTQSPEKSPSLRFDTRPPFTSTSDRIMLTWPYFPHTINAMRSVDLWIKGPAVGICTDDGSILIWHSQTLAQEVTRLKSVRPPTGDPDSRFYGLKLAADVDIKMDSSAWGLDFASAADSKGNKHHILAVSANSQSASLFYYDQNQFHRVQTHQVLHNIPEVSFVSYTIEDGEHTVFLSCASISGELLLFKFTFRIVGEKTAPTGEWPKRLGRVVFDEPYVVRRTNLGSDCWTTKPIHKRYFRPVQSIRAMTGDPFIDDDMEAKQILGESALLGMAQDPLKTANLGTAASWQFFESPVVCLEASEVLHHHEEDTSKFTSVDEEYRRIHQIVKAQCITQNETVSKPLEDVILAVSTDKRVGLFRADSLLCIAATKQLFTLDIPQNEDTRWCNRISISQVIPEILCFIAVTQLGLVTIMRLCEHRGLYGMRQEHLFPNALSLAVGESTLRTITGLAVRNMSVLPLCPRFFLYLTYSDGLMVTYELRDRSDDYMEVTF